MLFEDDDIRWLLEVLTQEGLEEIEVEQGDLRIRVRACSQIRQPVSITDAAAAVSGVAQSQQPATPPPAGIPLPAPMAGIFYRQPSPDADPFVEEGDRVAAGDVVGLIEVMKLFNEVIAPVSGIVTKIMVENEERVEAEQPLMYIQPAARND